MPPPASGETTFQEPRRVPGYQGQSVAILNVELIVAEVPVGQCTEEEIEITEIILQG